MSGLGAVFLGELRRIFALRPVFSVLVGAVVIYAFLYPQPYLNEALRDVPIAIVDSDGTVTSRELARRLDASPDVAAAMVLPDIAAAEREIQRRRVWGALLIPQDFERDLLHGRAAPVALYADASYFLMYQRISGAVIATARSYGAEVETARLIGVGVDPALAAVAAAPLALTAVPLFNPEGGYATYILPAAFVLILQQTLLAGIGLLGTLPGARAARAGPLATVAGKALAYLALQAVVVPLYVIALPALYGVPRLGSVGAIVLFAVPFVLAVGTLGLVVAATFRSPMLVQLAVAMIGLPFFFLSGFAWPTEAMPEPLRLLAQFVPSTSAIEGLVRISQMGATVADVRVQFLSLCALALLFGVVAVLLEARTARVPGRA